MGSPAVGDYAYIKGATASDPAAIYECVTAGTWSDSGRTVDVSNVQTFETGQSVNGTGIKDLDGNNDPNAAGVLSAEAGKELADVTTEIVVSENILNPNSIILNRRIKPGGTEADNNNSTAGIVYGCTPYIELPDEGLTLNHGMTMFGSSICGVIVYNSDFVKIGKKNTLSNGIPLFVSPTNYTEEAAQGVEDLTPKYVRFNLYKPEIPYDGTNDGYAIYKGSTLPSSFIPYFSPRREMKQQEIKDGAITADKIKDGAITVDKIEKTITEFASDNICNPNECYFGNDKYISRNSGNITSFTISSIGGYTGFIPIDSRGLSLSPIVHSGSGIGGAVYCIDGNGNKVFKRSAGSSGIVAYDAGDSSLPETDPLHYPDAFVRFTLAASATHNTVMVNVGTALKDYVPYLGTRKVISKEILPKSSDSDNTNYEDGVSIVLPSNIYCTKGDTLYLYWRSFIEAVNPKVFDCCSPNSTTTNNVLSYPDCLKIARTSDTPFNVVVRDNVLNEVAKKTVNFKAVNVPTSPASAVNVLLVGASREANGVTPLEVYRRLVGDNTMSPAGLGLTNINFVGRKGCKAYDCNKLGYPSTLYSQVKHEAVSGKKIHDMVVAGDLTGYTFYFEPNPDYVFNQGDKYTDGTRVYTVVGSDPAAGDLQVSISSGSGTPSATGTLTLTDGSGVASVNYTSYENEISNPFWNSSTGKIDFAKYSTDYCNGATISILVLCRVMNDLWNGRTPIQVVTDYTTVIDAFHEYNPNGYVIINLAVLPSMYGGLPHSYTNGKPLSTAWYAARINLETQKLLIELGESYDYKDFCLLSNTNAEFDLDYFYSKEATTIRNRGNLKTVDYDNNGLHFNQTGKQVVADSIYHCVCKIINDINGQS